MLVARAGFKVSPEGLCKTSIWVQLLLCGGGVLLPLFLSVPAHAVLPTIGTVLHIFNLITVYNAQVRRTDYPWHVLKWTFPIGAAAYSLTAISELARTLPDMERVPVLRIALSAVFYLIPACLQTALLWWREVGHGTVEEMEP